MEAVERLAVHYPELEPLSAVFKELSHGFLAVHQVVPHSSPEVEAKAVVLNDTSEYVDFASALVPEAEKLRADSSDVALTSLAALEAQLQTAIRQSPEFSRAIGGEAMCDGLRDMLAHAGGSIPAWENETLHQWIQDYVRDTMNDLFDDGQQLSRFLEGTMAIVKGSVEEIRQLSEQIAQPGFRADRVQLMDRRSVLVRQLLAALSGKERAVLSSEQKISGFLDSKLRNFEQAHSACSRTRRERLHRHSIALEDLGRGTAALQKYAQAKADSLSREAAATRQRSERRGEEVRRVAGVLQQAFAQLLRIVEECRADGDLLVKRAAELRSAEETVSHTKERYGEFGRLHEGSASRLDKCGVLETKFGEWIREAYSVMNNKLMQDMKALHANLPADKARMQVLSRKAVDQVRTQRDQVQRGLEQRGKEIASCQDQLSLLEFSKPTDEEIAKPTKRIAELNEAAKWQRQQMEALSVIEHRLSEEAGHYKVGSSGLGGIGEEQWSQEMESAEGWAADIFHHFDKPAWTESLEDDSSWRFHNVFAQLSPLAHSLDAHSGAGSMEVTPGRKARSRLLPGSSVVTEAEGSAWDAQSPRAMNGSASQAANRTPSPAIGDGAASARGLARTPASVGHNTTMDAESVCSSPGQGVKVTASAVALSQRAPSQSGQRRAMPLPRPTINGALSTTSLRHPAAIDAAFKEPYAEPRCMPVTAAGSSITVWPPGVPSKQAWPFPTDAAAMGSPCWSPDATAAVGLAGPPSARSSSRLANLQHPAMALGSSLLAGRFSPQAASAMARCSSAPVLQPTGRGRMVHPVGTTADVHLASPFASVHGELNNVIGASGNGVYSPGLKSGPYGLYK